MGNLMAWSAVWGAAVFGVGAPVLGADRIVDVRGQLSGRMEWAKHLELLSRGSTPPDDPYPAGYLVASLTVTPHDSLMGRLTIGSREVSRQTIVDGALDDRWDSARFVDEAFVRLKSDPAWIRVGKQRVVTGAGLILDDYQPATAGGMTFDGAGGTRVRLKGLIAGVDEDGALRSGQSLHAAFTGELLPSLFRRLWVSVAYLDDRDGLINRLLPPAVTLAGLNLSFEPKGGRLTWWVLGGDASAHGWTVEGVGIIETGDIDVTATITGPLGGTRTEHRTIKVDGLATHLKASYAATEALALGGFAVYTSGDGRRPQDVWVDERYDGFVSIFPHLDDTNLFFQGGINQSFETGRTASSGVDGRGVWAIGAEAEWDRAKFSNRTVVAHLWSEFPPEGASATDYGWEIDTEWSYRWNPWLTFRVEGDVLFTGSFFDASTSPTPETISKAVVGVDIAF